MFSLTYTPAYDPYHTVFRLLVLLTHAQDQTLLYRTARVADFYMCFPWSLKDVRAPKHIEGFAKGRTEIVKKYKATSYDRFPSARVVFERMEMIQATAVSALVGAKMIGAPDHLSGSLKLLPENVPAKLMAQVQNSSANIMDLVQFLATALPKIDALGKDGVYARSGLGEFSYDVL